MSSIDPQPPSLEDLGAIRHVLRPALINLFAGLILGIGAISGGVAIVRSMVIQFRSLPGWPPLYADKDLSWFAIGFFLLFSTALTTGGALLFWWAIKHLTLVVKVCDAGFEWRTWASAKRYRWEDMEMVRESIFGERSSAADAAKRNAIPTQTVREFRIFLKDGRQLSLTANTLRNHGTLGYLAQQEAITRGIPTEVFPKLTTDRGTVESNIDRNDFQL